MELRNITYYPTYVTEASLADLGVGANAIADYRSRDLSNKIMRVQEIAATPNTNVTARIKEDIRSIEDSNTISLDHDSIFDLQCVSAFALSFHSTAVVSNYTYRYGYWMINPTIADKLFYKVKLNPVEKEICEELDLEKLVKNGDLPLPLDVILKRLFKKTSIRTVSQRLDVSSSGRTNMGKQYSPVDSFVILESVAFDKPPDDTYTTALKLTIDDKQDVHTMKTCACSGSTTDIPLFIPARDSIELELTSNKVISNYDCRYTYSEVRITEMIEQLFGLKPESKNPEIAKAIKAGTF